MIQRRVHPLTLVLTTSHVTIHPGIMVHEIIRLEITSQRTIQHEITRHGIRAHVAATILRVNHNETRLSFEDFLKRLFVASLAVDWTSSFAFCCDLCFF